MWSAWTKLREEREVRVDDREKGEKALLEEMRD